MPPLPASTTQHEKVGMEKHVLPTHSELQPSRKSVSRLRASLCLLAGLVCLGVVFNGGVPRIHCHGRMTTSTSAAALDAYAKSELCPQEPGLTPSTQPNAELWSTLVPLDNGTYASNEFLNKAVNWLGGAVRVK